MQFQFVLKFREVCRSHATSALLKSFSLFWHPLPFHFPLSPFFLPSATYSSHLSVKNKKDISMKQPKKAGSPVDKVHLYNSKEMCTVIQCVNEISIHVIIETCEIFHAFLVTKVHNMVLSQRFIIWSFHFRFAFASFYILCQSVMRYSFII